MYGYLFSEMLHELDLIGVFESWKVAASDKLHRYPGCLADVQ
jgi:hypothetical protein